MIQMIEMISVNLNKCTGCRRCEIVCAFFHTGRVSSKLARIKVVNIYEKGIDGPVVCNQCSEKYCMECPVHALTVGSSGQIIHSPTICVLCGRCEDVCPIGALEIFGGFVYVCDLCGGRPQCVKACTEGALVYNPEGERPSLERFKSTEKMNPGEKRYTYIEKTGTESRKKWREIKGKMEGDYE